MTLKDVIECLEMFETARIGEKIYSEAENMDKAKHRVLHQKLDNICVAIKRYIHAMTAEPVE